MKLKILLVFLAFAVSGAALLSLGYRILSKPTTNESTSFRVLIVASKTDLSAARAESERAKLDVFRDILVSHWGLSVDVISFENIDKKNPNNYAAFFIINTDNSPFPLSLYQRLAQNGKVASIGYNTFTDSEKGALKKVDHLEYKNIPFRYKGIYIFSNQTIPFQNIRESGDSEQLAFAVSDSALVPIVLKEKENVFISLNLPNYYETDSGTTIFLSVVEKFLGFDSGDRSTEALVRLEDVNPFTYKDTTHLKEVFTLLQSRKAGFNIALIPQYLNPQKDISIALSEAPDLVALLREYQKKGMITLVQHGYTHQTGNEETAIGFEFWDGDTDEPLARDSREYVLKRVSLAKVAVEQTGLPIPYIWETPHYTLSELDNDVINELYGFRYERTREFGALPFVITRDYGNGSRVTYIPENLNYIEREEDMDRIEKELLQLETITTSTPSFFWHPWRNKAELERMLDLFKREGYTFVTADALLQKESKDY